MVVERDGEGWVLLIGIKAFLGHDGRVTVSSTGTLLQPYTKQSMAKESCVRFESTKLQICGQ